MVPLRPSLAGSLRGRPSASCGAACLSRGRSHLLHARRSQTLRNRPCMTAVTLCTKSANPLRVHPLFRLLHRVAAFGASTQSIPKAYNTRMACRPGGPMNSRCFLRIASRSARGMTGFAHLHRQSIYSFDQPDCWRTDLDHVSTQSAGASPVVHPLGVR